MRSWLIGSKADCDVVVDSPMVSGRHCQLTQIPQGFFLLEDLGSTNGTFVDGVRITAPTRITPGESITLGKTTPMPWPAGVVTVVRVGRLGENDVVIDDPRVSGHHARLLVATGARTMIEDVGSSNGTFLNSPDRRVTRPTALAETDTVYFGTMALPAARLLGECSRMSLAEAAPRAEGPTAVSPPRPPLSAAATFPEANRGTTLLLAQAPLIAIMIVLFFGRFGAALFTPARAASAGQVIASTSFALAIAAIWCGGSLAVAEFASGRLARRSVGRDEAKWFFGGGARLVVFCGMECAVLLAIVYMGSALKGPPLAMWAMLVMASLLGLLLGLVVTGLAPSRAAAAVILLASFICMIAFGGWIWPLPAISPSLRPIVQAMPSRWAFEGLFLLETGATPPHLMSAGANSTERPDLGETYFPVDSERMGPRADAAALGSMLIGLAAVAAFIRGNCRTGP
jgi:pSer/pThr/pTyr-binding forkhead associated (FHA) protein